MCIRDRSLFPRTTRASRAPLTLLRRFARDDFSRDSHEIVLFGFRQHPRLAAIGVRARAEVCGIAPGAPTTSPELRAPSLMERGSEPRQRVHGAATVAPATARAPAYHGRQAHAPNGSGFPEPTRVARRAAARITHLEFAEDPSGQTARDASQLHHRRFADSCRYI